jgi:hypothetical protein
MVTGKAKCSRCDKPALAHGLCRRHYDQRYYKSVRKQPKPASYAHTLVRKYYPEVLTVMDAKQALTVEVTDEDRVRGRGKDPKACALARACGRSWDGAVIGLKTIYLIKGTRATRFMTPESISREIVSFDRNQDFAAGTYRLRPPGGTTRLGHHTPWGSHKHTGSQTGRMQHRTVRVRSLQKAAP